MQISESKKFEYNIVHTQLISIRQNARTKVAIAILKVTHNDLKKKTPLLGCYIQF